MYGDNNITRENILDYVAKNYDNQNEPMIIRQVMFELLHTKFVSPSTKKNRASRQARKFFRSVDKYNKNGISNKNKRTVTDARAKYINEAISNAEKRRIEAENKAYKNARDRLEMNLYENINNNMIRKQVEEHQRVISHERRHKQLERDKRELKNLARRINEEREMAELNAKHAWRVGNLHRHMVRERFGNNYADKKFANGYAKFGKNIKIRK